MPGRGNREERSLSLAIMWSLVRIIPDVCTRVCMCVCTRVRTHPAPVTKANLARLLAGAVASLSLPRKPGPEPHPSTHPAEAKPPAKAKAKAASPCLPTKGQGAK